MRDVEKKILEKMHEIKQILDENGGCEQLNLCICHVPDAYCGDSNYFSFFNAYFPDGGLDKDNPINYSEFEPIAKEVAESEEVLEEKSDEL